ncbi:hypothetical protein VKT23_004078 [Stygiomarasmius scandens]|uniref:FUN14 family protein n=1 Tax=Marasmiellus scandens TaxID=2682957 RepID=A0ABR1JXI2_9AGAR
MSFLSLISRQVNGRQLNTLKHDKVLNQFLHQCSRNYSTPVSKISVPRRAYSGHVLKGLGLTGVGLGLSLLRSPIKCEPTPPATTPSSNEQTDPMPPPPPPPGSSVSFYELSFGTVAGICAGVFVKKGLKTVAFFLGGVFVLLQYLGSYSVIRVDWAAIGRRFEKMFYVTDANGKKRAPTVYTAWHWLVDFLTADFQPRASFLAGLVLGLRIG